MKVYISYRRADSGVRVGRLGGSLAQRLGVDSILWDVEFLEAGADFRSQLTSAFEKADATLVVIGPDWLHATDAAGARRIDDASDTVRAEIAQALRMDKRLLPVLVGGATMPRAHELPTDIAALAHRHALELQDENWDEDINRIIAALSPARPASMQPPLAPTILRRRGTMPPPVHARSRFVPVLAISVTVLLLVMLAVWLYFPAPVQRPLPPPPTPTLAVFFMPWWAILLLAAVATLAAVLFYRHVYRHRRAAATEQKRAVPPVPVTNANTAQTTTTVPASSATGKVDVFVSHASEDHDLAEAIVVALERERLRCWIAPRDIPAGVRSWAGPIVEAIARSRVFVVILSSSSNSSIEVLREVTLANEEKVPFMPVRIDNSPLTSDFRYFFATAQRLEAMDWPREQVLSRIHSGVGLMMGGSAV